MPLINPDLDPENAFPWAATNLVPGILGAVALAGIVAAVLSTASSLFQQAAATISRDIYQRYLNPGVSDTKLLIVSRLCVLAVAVVVFVVTAQPEIGAFGVLYGYLFAAAFWAAWLPALYAGIMWRGATTAAAAWSMIGGGVIALLVGTGRVYEITPQWLPPSVSALLGAAVILIIVSTITQSSDQESEVYERMREPEDPEDVSEEVRADERS